MKVNNSLKGEETWETAQLRRADEEYKGLYALIGTTEITA